MARGSKTDAFLADTHALLWHLERSAELGTQARAVFEAADAGQVRVFISAITPVELVYLQDKGTIPGDTLDKTFVLLRGSANYVLITVNLRVIRALSRIARSQVPDMPDRIIGATGLSYGLPILTRDSELQKHPSLKTIW